MDDDERAHLEKQRQIKRQRLHVLEEQAAVYGINVPAEIRIEIDGLRTEIAGIDARLAAAAALRLSTPVPDFVGRTGEIAKLGQAFTSALRRGKPAIGCVRGLGGVGKTQLAYTLAERLAASFPDGQIMLSLRGADPDPMTPTLALQTVIHIFDPAVQLPDDLAQLQARYQAVLEGKRMLILADDAKDAAQVRPLMPPTGCALLVTSRARFALPGMAVCDLEALPEVEAVELLLEICPRIGEAAARLVKLCGCLPLALRISASVLANDDTLGVARYLERLDRERLAAQRDPDEPEADVEASLRLSFDALEPPARAVLCQIGVFVASFDLAAAEAVVQVPDVKDVGDALGLLRRRSLLEWDTAKERYRLHELVRAFTIGRLADVESVWLRYARYYAQIALKADTLYKQGHASLFAGLALFDAERLHIDAGWRWSREHAGETLTDELLLDYADATAHIGDLRYDKRHERILQLESALDAARRLGRKNDEGSVLGNLGSAYRDLGEVRRTIEYYKQVLTIMREINDRRGEGTVLGNLGLAYANLGEVRRAIEYYEQHLVIARELGDRHGEGNTLDNLGNAYRNLGEVHKAIECYEQCLVIVHEIGDRRGEGAALGNLGLAYAKQGEVHHAIKLYEQQLVIAREIGDRYGEANALGNLGNVYQSLGDVHRAIEYHDLCLALLREIGDRQGEGTALGNLGNDYMVLGEVRRAIEHYDQVLTIMHEIGDRRGEADTLFNTSLVLDALGDRPEAIAHAEMALQIFEQIESPHAARVRRQLAHWREPQAPPEGEQPGD